MRETPEEFMARKHDNKWPSRLRSALARSGVSIKGGPITTEERELALPL